MDDLGYLQEFFYVKPNKAPDPNFMCIEQGWATLGTRAELGTRTLISGTRVRPQKRDPSSFK